MGKYETLILYLIVELIAIFFMYMSSGKKIVMREIGNNNKISRNEFFIIISFGILFLLLALRDNVGADYLRYVELYDQIGMDTLNINEKEWLSGSLGYWIFNRLLYYVGASHYLMFAVMGFTTLFFFFKAIKTQSTNGAFSLYIFICFCLYYQCFNTIRQMLAIAIVFYSYRYLSENKLQKYVIYVLVAALFHKSVLVCLLIWPIRKLKINYETLFMYTVAGSLFFFGFDFLLNIFSHTTYVSTYINSGQYSMSFGMSTLLNFGVRLFMFVFSVCFYRETIRRNIKMIPLYNIAAICTIAQLGAIRFNLFGRLTTYFYVIYIILLPEVFKSMEEKFSIQSRKIIRIAVFSFLAIYHFVYYFSSRGAISGGYINYQMIHII